MLTGHSLVIILHYLQIWNHHVVHLKLIGCRLYHHLQKVAGWDEKSCLSEHWFLCVFDRTTFSSFMRIAGGVGKAS